MVTVIDHLLKFGMAKLKLFFFGFRLIKCTEVPYYEKIHLQDIIPLLFPVLRYGLYALNNIISFRIGFEHNSNLLLQYRIKLERL